MKILFFSFSKIKQDSSQTFESLQVRFKTPVSFQNAQTSLFSCVDPYLNALLLPIQNWEKNHGIQLTTNDHSWAIMTISDGCALWTIFTCYTSHSEATQ